MNWKSSNKVTVEVNEMVTSNQKLHQKCPFDIVCYGDKKLTRGSILPVVVVMNVVTVLCGRAKKSGWRVTQWGASHGGQGSKTKAMVIDILVPRSISIEPRIIT